MNSSNPPPWHIPSPDGPPRLFCIVSTLKSREYTPHALRSFFETTSLRAVDRCILINNDDPAIHETVSPFEGRLTLINNATPKSFAANANSMISRALDSRSDLFFMNNDIIFTDNWLPPLTGNDRSILSPISNREVQYAASTVVTKTEEVAKVVITSAPMGLDEYLASPRMFQAIAESHRSIAQGLMRLTVFPFFCVKLPIAVMREIGAFDESFGRAGGEDYDYCLRAWLAGFNVQMVVSSYLIHFWGKSTWNGGEPAPRNAYNSDFLEIFRAKWGEALFQYVLQENDDLIRANPEAVALRASGDIGGMVRLMMSRPVDVYRPLSKGRAPEA